MHLVSLNYYRLRLGGLADLAEGDGLSFDLGDRHGKR